ncbi:MAG: hypothetical protein J6C46_10905 [Clostridia bacterium]|nr:hypothetical protein [Clostridia bacterium]
MSKFKRFSLLTIIIIMALALTGCSSNYQDIADTRRVSESLVDQYPTPVDIETSLSRENLIRRAYFLAGNLEKARNYPSKVPEKPLGYLYLFVEGVGCVMRDTVDGIPTSMRSYLTPDSTYYSSETTSLWLADVDGTYGENPDGIFWFDANGMYHEWVGLYYYSDTYYEIDDPIININVEGIVK